MHLKFENPVNGYVEESSLHWLWALLFGPIYFASKGIWTHAVISFLLAGITWGISWVIYPVFASNIVYEHFMRRGWKHVA